MCFFSAFLVLFEVEVISYIQANAYDEYQSTPEEQRKKLSVQQMLIICNCLREVFVSFTALSSSLI